MRVKVRDVLIACDDKDLARLRIGDAAQRKGRE
jgi:hypothetical protein